MSRTRRSLTMRGLLISVIFAAPISAAPAPARASGKIVSLPPLLVSAASSLHWRYVAMPGFEILSCCPDDVTAPFVQKVYLNQFLLDAIAPGDLQVRPAVPTALILLHPGVGDGFPEKFMANAKELRAQTSDELARVGTPSLAEAPGSIPQIKLQDGDSIGADIILNGQFRGFEFDPGYVFFALDGRKPPLPLWFIEGTLNFHYHAPRDGFQIKKVGRYGDLIVNVPPAFWISRDVTDCVRASSEETGSGKESWDVLLPILMQRLLSLRKAVTEPPGAGDRSAGSELDRGVRSIRMLLSGPPPPPGTNREKYLWMERAGLDYHRNAPPGSSPFVIARLQRLQVQYILQHGAEDDSPWRLELWRSKPALLERMVFDGFPIRRLLTEKAPPPAGDSDKEAWLARAGLGTPSGEDPEGVLALRRTWSVMRDGSDEGSPWRLDIWRSQAALFVRWAFDDPTHSRREALWKLARYACQAPVTEAVFRDCFGMSFAEMDEQLYEYLPVAMTKQFVLFPRRSIRIPDVDLDRDTSYSESLSFSDRPRDLVLRDSTVAERVRILGDWERKEIDFVRDTQPEFADLYIKQAQSTLVSAYGKGARDPGLLAALGLFECAIHNDIAAQGFLELAVSAQVVRPRAYVELARIRLANALAEAGGVGENLNASQAA